jgi:hypothetical protein
MNKQQAAVIPEGVHPPGQKHRRPISCGASRPQKTRSENCMENRPFFQAIAEQFRMGHKIVPRSVSKLF